MPACAQMDAQAERGLHPASHRRGCCNLQKSQPAIRAMAAVIHGRQSPVTPEEEEEAAADLLETAKVDLLELAAEAVEAVGHRAEQH